MFSLFLPKNEMIHFSRLRIVHETICMWTIPHHFFPGGSHQTIFLKWNFREIHVTLKSFHQLCLYGGIYV